ncbi:MAG: RNA methyltransferase [Lepagella sp.]|jgi:hypothetical protein
MEKVEKYPRLSKTMAGRLHQLRLKKHRDERGVFVAEGGKCVGDTLGHFELVSLVATEKWFAGRPHVDGEVFLAGSDQMRQVSSLSTAPEVLAVYRRPEYEPDEKLVSTDLTLLLDGVQDPGNLGTIVRLCDWFGVRQIIASPACADLYNAKAVQATMGSISRVRVFYRNLGEFVSEHREVPVAGLLLNGENIYSATLPKPCLVVMGNEGRGITEEMRRLLTLRLLIPSYPAGAPTAESLNVAMATAITLSEFRRRE